MRIDGTKHEFDLDEIAAALPLKPFSWRQLADVMDIGGWNLVRPIRLLTEAGLIRRDGYTTETGHGGRMHLYKRLSASRGPSLGGLVLGRSEPAASVAQPPSARRSGLPASLAPRRRVRSVLLRKLAKRVPVGRFTLADFATATGVEPPRARYYLKRLMAAGYVLALGEGTKVSRQEQAFVASPVEHLPALPKRVPLANLAASVPSRVFRTSQFASRTGLGWHRAHYSLQRMQRVGLVQPAGPSGNSQPTQYRLAAEPRPPRSH